ncbi:type II toxin-antitoxin system VapC family toxin [Desulforhabdus sp. TSK]|uniref:type II toxin-antitoxin system VapC family toxin n=1 Tax=Desulforhabdus sp. TSK TaxID=2925014 RepID=UPI001FC8BF41|nr:type II toxin-antitoxin system VapC family toxin [Desulforhabdus sp. TSK]GKT08210.1 nucleotide-binding protein [Desulforhabdus sp. TSK]
MKINYLIDTDWVIHFLNGTQDIVDKLKQLRTEGLAISIITLAELYEGVFYSRNPEASRDGLANFLRGIVIIDIDDEICTVFGKERGRLRRQGNIIGDFDLLIGATCLSYDFTLLTNNVRHFERLEGLKVISSKK